MDPPIMTTQDLVIYSKEIFSLFKVVCSSVENLSGFSDFLHLNLNQTLNAEDD